MEYIIQLNYYNYLDYNDYIKLLETTKRFYYNKDYNHDLIYKYYVINKFSKEFVEELSSFIFSYYDCLLRIVIFENTLKKLGYEIWKENLYYAYWKAKNLLELKGQYMLDITMV
tara:strand:- start:170 stop:511 length:342 start_codon:yes stop_codon:yes gene_type:complete